MIPCQRHLFDLPEDLAYLNCAYTSPLLKSASAAGLKAIDQKKRPWGITPQHFFETAEENRTLFSRLVSGHPDNVAIIPAVSYGIALAAKNLPVAKGQTILVIADQFPSNIYAWRRIAESSGAVIKTIPRPENYDWTTSVLNAIDRGTAIAALPNCHWTDGTVLDLVRIGEQCRSVGAALVVDGIQSLGVMPFSVEAVQPDFLATAAHKWMLGPYTYGFCYIADKWLNGTPLEENWLNRRDSEDFSRLVDYRNDYQPGARRFDMGAHSSFFLAPIANAALNRILSWGVERIAATLQQKIAEIAAFAIDLGFTIAPEHARAKHMIGLYMPDGLPADAGKRLAKENVFVSVRGNAIRVAPHLYNSADDLSRLRLALKKTIR